MSGAAVPLSLRPERGLRAVGNLELVEDAGDVVLHGLQG